MRNDVNLSKEKDQLLYWLLIYGFNRMLRFNGNGNFNLPVGNLDFNKNVVTAIESYFDEIDKKEVVLFNLDFEEFLRNTPLSKQDFVYLDPPYLITFSEYNKLWDENSEERLIECLEFLNKNKIKFAVSNIIYHQNKYTVMFRKWARQYNIVQIKSNFISSHNNKFKDSTELLVKNYE